MKREVKTALALLLLLAANAVQVVAATHWHAGLDAAVSVSVEDSAAVPQPSRAPDGLHHDGCLLCQIAAHAGSAAPPVAPWCLFAVMESRAASLHVLRDAAPAPPASHSWQGRAPPLI